MSRHLKLIDMVRALLLVDCIRVQKPCVSCWLQLQRHLANLTQVTSQTSQCRIILTATDCC